MLLITKSGNLSSGHTENAAVTQGVALLSWEGKMESVARVSSLLEPGGQLWIRYGFNMLTLMTQHEI